MLKIPLTNNISYGKRLSCLVCLFFYGFFCQQIYAGTISNYTFNAKNYSGSRDRNYQVYRPSGLTAAAPLVMVLHGCVQDGSDSMDNWGFQAAADSNGFILVTPSITSYDGQRSENCWGFWFDQHTHAEQGEPEDLHQLALEVESNYNIDPQQRFIAGFSAGGAMAEIAAITHNDYWSAAAVASGLAYSETSSSVSLAGCWGSPQFKSINSSANSATQELNNDYAIPIMVLQNDNDCVVQQPAGRNIRDLHLRLFGGTKVQEVNCEFYLEHNYDCLHTYYADSETNQTTVETVFFDGPLQTPSSGDSDYGHYWVAGSAGNIDTYTVKKGPDYPALIVDFFNRHSRDGNGAPIGTPGITLLGENPLQINIGDSFSDPGASATDLEDGQLTVSADCLVDTNTVGEYYCTYTAEDGDGNTAVRSRTILVVDPSAPAETCAVVSASPSAHIAEARAVKGGLFDLEALTKSDRVAIGKSYDSWSQITLYEGTPGEWYSARLAACSGGTGDFECHDWEDSNWNHIQAGRAASDLGYAITVGSGDNLGLANIYTFSWVKETEEGFFASGQCP